MVMEYQNFKIFDQPYSGMGDLSFNLNSGFFVGGKYCIFFSNGCLINKSFEFFIYYGFRSKYVREEIVSLNSCYANISLLTSIHSMIL